MKTRSNIFNRTALAAAVVVAVGGMLTFDVPTGTQGGMSALVSSAYAAEDGSGGGKKGAMGENRGGQGGQGAGSQGYRGGKSMTDVLSEDGATDSDRPDWAGVPGGEDRPGGGGNTQPGTVKGDEYGDLIVLLRDPVTGEPVLIDGEMQVCTSADCSTYESMVGGEVPAGVTPIEVDFGRAAVARSPTNVLDHALEEAISKLTVDNAVIGQDLAGRITITVNGVTSTIDSPLENLALFVDLMTGLASDSTSQTEDALGSLANLDVAASLLAGVADKTGDISVDFVVYNNVISDVVDSGDYYDFSSFTYSRTYPTDYTYWYSPDGVVAPVPLTLDVNAYLDAINGALPTDGGVTLFAAAADDALEVIELVHTQVFTGEELPGTQ